MSPFEVYSLENHQKNSSPHIEWEILSIVPVLSPRHAKDTLVQRSSLGVAGLYVGIETWTSHHVA